MATAPFPPFKKGKGKPPPAKRDGGMPMDMSPEMMRCMKKMSHAQCLKMMKKNGM